MLASLAVSELDCELARKINEESRDNPNSTDDGKFVGISSGAVVAVADDLGELAERLREIRADSLQSLCLEVGLDFGQVQEIWGLR